MSSIVYIVVSGGGVESIWTTPLAAVEKREGIESQAAYVAVRPLDSDEPTEESKAALLKLRDLERERHNERARKLREGA